MENEQGEEKERGWSGERDDLSGAGGNVQRLERQQAVSGLGEGISLHWAFWKKKKKLNSVK